MEIFSFNHMKKKKNKQTVRLLQIQSIKFTDNKILVAIMINPVFLRIENIVEEKGVNTVYQHFGLYSTLFCKLCLWIVKCHNIVVES